MAGFASKLKVWIFPDFVTPPGFLQLGSCMPLDLGGFLISLDFLFHRKGVRTLSGTTLGDVGGW